MTSVSISNEFSQLESAIIGRGVPFQRNKAQVAAEMAEFPLIPDTDRKAEVLALEYPTEDILSREFADFVAVLQRHQVDVLIADPEAAYSFDYTCPRDIGFVIGDRFFISSMSVSSRASEIETIRHHIEPLDADKVVQVPTDCLLEGGDVMVLDDRIVLVGIHQRSNRAGYEFLRSQLHESGYQVLPVPHRQLHLDCCLNPLGLGHLLIHRESIEPVSQEVRGVLESYQWIEIDAMEREYLATNVLSINPQTVVARNHHACARVNRVLREVGYTVESVGFDGVPATGGSFRCASLVMRRGV